MLVVQVWCCIEAYKEGASVGIRATVGHRELAFVGVRNPGGFIRKVISIDALVAVALGVDNATALHHKAWDNAVEKSVCVVQVASTLTSAQRSEILDCYRDFFRE